MKYNTKEIVDGLHNGKMVWICDYRFNDINEKPIRLVEPTNVLIRDCKETSKNVYYSNSFFSKINDRNELVKSSIIKIFDNTGYRTYPGVPLNVFDNKEECYECFVELILINNGNINLWYKNISDKYKNLIDINNDYFSLYNLK